MYEDIFIQINRAKAKYEIMLVLGITFIATGFLLFMGIPPLGFILFALGGTLSVISRVGYSRLCEQLKGKVMNSIVNEHVTNGVYRASPGIPKELVYQSEILRKASRYNSEDYIEGKISGVHFIFSDLHLEETTSSGENTQYVTTFKGPFFQFDFNKNFQGKTFIMEGTMPTFFHKYEKIKLESKHFNDIFNVYSNNPHNAFYILTPHFMEVLLKLEVKHPGKLFISLMDNKLTIAIYNNKDTFKCPMFRQFDRSMIDEFRHDLLIIKDIIESLKIDQIIYKEE